MNRSPRTAADIRRLARRFQVSLWCVGAFTVLAVVMEQDRALMYVGPIAIGTILNMLSNMMSSIALIAERQDAAQPASPSEHLAA